MKLKNTNFIERHVEKIILAVGASLALVVVWLFVLGNPYGITIGNRELQPNEIGQAMREPAEQLEQKLVANEIPPELKIPKTGFTPRFIARNQDGAPPDAWAFPLGESAGLADKYFKDVSDTLVKYAEAVPPLPTNVQVSNDLHVLRPHEQLAAIFAQHGSTLEQDEQRITARQMGKRVADRYGHLVPAALPRDFEAISVMAEFDWEAWVAELQKHTIEKSIPEIWWRGPPVLMDVILHRQVMDPKTGIWGAVKDGKWQDDAVKRINPLPGAWSFRKMPQQMTGAMLASLTADPNIQEQICRPLFPPVNGVWLPPDEQTKRRSAEDEEDLLSLNRKIGDREARMLKLVEQVEKMEDREREVEQRKAASKDGDSDRLQPQRQRHDRNQTQTLTGTPGTARGGSRGRIPTMAHLPNQKQAGIGHRASTTQTLRNKQQTLQGELDELYHQRQVLLGFAEDGEGDDKDGANGQAGQSGNRRHVFHRGGGDLFGRNSPTGLGTKASAPMMPPTGLPMMHPGSVRMRGRNSGTTSQARRHGIRDHRTDLQEVDPEEQQIEPIIVWAHDLTVEPGRIYRYQIVVAVRNPFFQRRRVVKSQLHLTKQHSLESKPSRWTDAIETFHKTYFYLVDDGNQNEGGIVEMYRRFNGGWQRKESSVRVGEPIGEEFEMVAFNLKRMVNFAEDVSAIVVDVNRNVASIASPARNTVRMLYLDTQSNELMERTVESDKKNQRRIYLRNEAQLEAERIEMAQVESR